MRNILLLVALLLLMGAGFVHAQQPAPLKVEQGLLQGIVENGVTVYKGVPFAEPPVGKSRWCPPQPPKSWEGVRKADKFSANPMQVMVNGLGPWTPEYQPQGEISEDCLYLNIWTKAKSSDDKLPVLVYIPGGAFTGGSGNVPVYNGENLAKKDLVLVTVNYRVGVFGFFAYPELSKESNHNSSGNYGLLDQLAALEWIKKNISAFGGDPERVTIMGQSAGAASVHYLTASPLAKGLFIRAIAQSGSNARTGPGENLSSAEQNGLRFAKAVNAANLSELRKISASDLIGSANNQFRFSPVVDGWFLPKSVDEIFASGQQNDVTTLTGFVKDEGSYGDNYGKISVEDFRKRVKQQTGPLADEILKLYPGETEEANRISQKEFACDMSMVSMYMWAKQREKTAKTKTYTYLFIHPQPGETKERYQTFHSSELPYIFDNLNHSNRPWAADDKMIAKMMSSYWKNFIAYGDPNGQGLPKWPTFSEAPEETMALGDKIEPRLFTTRDKFDVLKKLLQDPQR
jgi:para-nitrobenzyl esterase